jgi:peptidoglycan hydrolase-like protein with peptidoglycan-binding domain
LKSLGFYTGGIDGIYGAGTEKALTMLELKQLFEN